jgi:hypothetical protein
MPLARPFCSRPSLLYTARSQEKPLRAQFLEHLCLEAGYDWALDSARASLPGHGRLPSSRLAACHDLPANWLCCASPTTLLLDCDQSSRTSLKGPDSPMLGIHRQCWITNLTALPQELG